jgi:hypothetical protein
MNLFAPFKPMAVQFGRSLWFGFIFLSGVLVADASQNPCWRDQRGFWSILPVACVHIILASFYFRRVRHWSRWPVAILAVIALAFFSEMIWRVWIS